LSDGVERALAPLRRFELARSALFWLPVYYLLFEQHLPAEQVLGLASIYYLAGVLLEVPSGIASDRLGRKPTLVIAAALQLVGAIAMVGAESLAGFAFAQACLSAAVAFVSGTDTSYLYEHLRSAGRESEVTEQEARLQRIGLFGMSFGAFAGGACGSLDLRLPYLLTALTSGLALASALRLVEPAHLLPAPERLDTAVLRRGLRDPVLRWGLGLAIAAMVFNHVPFELLQPYLSTLGAGSARLTPLTSGAVLGTTMWLAVVASRRAPALGRRLGLAGGALAGLSVQALVTGLLALAVHPILAAAFLLRSVPQALLQPLSRALLHPRLPDAHRATWFSFQSLVARLAFAAVLWLAAGRTRGLEHLDAPTLSTLFRVAWLGLLATILGLWFTRPRPSVPPTDPHR
jgi:hypothetical protein